MFVRGLKVVSFVVAQCSLFGNHLGFISSIVVRCGLLSSCVSGLLGFCVLGSCMPGLSFVLSHVGV